MARLRWPRGRGRRRWTTGQIVAAIAGVLLIAAGGSALGLAAAAQNHAPQPGSAQAGTTGPAGRTGGGHHGAARGRRPACSSRRCGAVPGSPGGTPSGPVKVSGPSMARSRPLTISIPAIGVRSKLLYVGLNRDGTLQAPPLNDPPVTNEAAWYRYSPTPGQVGPSIIEGHVDSASDGPSVFFRLGALKPGDRVDVALADHKVAVFKITGVRRYDKNRFPTRTVYGNLDFAGLRLITCGGSFDYQTRHYRSNVVAFATLVSSHPA